MAKQRRERDQLDHELEDRKQLLKKVEAELKESAASKTLLKKQLDDYESKVKRLIYEFEEASKKHIRELNDVHEQYRGYKSNSIELEQRIAQYKRDMERAQEGERAVRKEIHRVNLENDEIAERLRYVESRYT
jgi:predicted  nucleic acid-binding Zn-ribbon protein